jgi:hypothetical protein
MAREPSQASFASSWNGRAEPSRARSGTEPHRADCRKIAPLLAPMSHLLGAVTEDWKDKFSEPVQRVEAARAWPSGGIKYENHGPVNRGNRRGSRHDHGRAGSNHVNRRAGAAGQLLIKLWPHLQAHILPWGGPGGHCRYPESGVLSSKIWRRCTRTTPPDRTEDGTRTHRIGRSKGTTWQGEIVHPRMRYWVRTSIEGHRTPVCTSPELPRRHVGSPRVRPGP